MYKVAIDGRLLSRLERLGKRNPSLIRLLDEFLAELATLDDPRSRGAPLRGPLAGFWRYRVGDWRLVCDIQDDVMTVVAFEFDRRDKVYTSGALLRYKRRTR